MSRSRIELPTYGFSDHRSNQLSYLEYKKKYRESRIRTYDAMNALDLQSSLLNQL